MRNCKEYLEKQPDGTYALVLRGDLCKESDILIPEGAECSTKCKDHNGDEWLLFWKGDYKFCVGHDKEWFYFESGVSEYLNDWSGLAKVIWQRATHPEELPFVDDETKYTDDEVKYMDENGQGRSQSLNDQYTEIEQVRQALKDNVNHPSHYADSAIECIDAMEAMMTPEQFIGYLRGNLFKYQWRYEKKNGIEDLKKAQWYLEKLTVKIAEKNALF